MYARARAYVCKTLAHAWRVKIYGAGLIYKCVRACECECVCVNGRETNPASVCSSAKTMEAHTIVVIVLFFYYYYFRFIYIYL